MNNSKPTSKVSKKIPRKDPHKRSKRACVDFTSVMECKRDSVLNQQSKSSLETVRKNRLLLSSIIEAILYLGRQGLAFRGHRDDSQYHDVPENNCGNFYELIRLMARGGNKVLEEHLQSHAKNASYLSKTTQNELI